jgi:hypothetical protein
VIIEGLEPTKEFLTELRSSQKLRTIFGEAKEQMMKFQCYQL